MTAGTDRRSWLSWPRGKYNGRRISGASIKVEVDLFLWEWLPRTRGMWKYSGFVAWLCFRLWVNWEYEPQWKVNIRGVNVSGNELGSNE